MPEETNTPTRFDAFAEGPVRFDFSSVADDDGDFEPEPQEPRQETLRAAAQEPDREAPRDAEQAPLREAAQDVPHEPAREAPREAAGEDPFARLRSRFSPEPAESAEPAQAESAVNPAQAEPAHEPARWDNMPGGRLDSVIAEEGRERGAQAYADIVEAQSQADGGDRSEASAADLIPGASRKSRPRTLTPAEQAIAGASKPSRRRGRPQDGGDSGFSRPEPVRDSAVRDAAWSQRFQDASDVMHRIVDNVATVVYGKPEVIELVMLSVVARGHVLIEDLPGTGKTSLISALAKSISCKFHRIQFTPDVMPSDVTGFSIFNQKTREFEFRPGGVMANIVLADEINRASAKTQSSLLEAMEERQVTVDSNTYKLEEPFMVLATQNPIEQFGTYPLPEAQVDRFLVKTSVGYPPFEQEERIIAEGRAAKAAIGPVAGKDDVVACSRIADEVFISPQVRRYIVEIVTSTRSNPEIQVGASPRATIALADLTRAFALFQGRSYVIPDDVKYLAHYVLGHRIQLSHTATVEGRTPRDVVDSIISSIAIPVSADAVREEANKRGARR